MLYLWSVRCLLLHLIFGQYHIHYTTAIWPRSNSSQLRLLGLFPDLPNEYDPETDSISVHSLAMFKAAILLSQKYNLTIGGQYLGWKVGHTGGDMIGALNSTCVAMPTAIILGIIGPALSREAHVIAALGKTIGIPVVSYSATDPELSHRSTYPAFYRTIPSDNAAALAIVKLFIQFYWTSCIVIYQNDEFGSGGADAISDIFDKNGLTVTETLVFDIATLTFRGDLKKTLSSSPTRIVLLWVESTHTTSILQNALDNDILGPQLIWILRSSIPLNTFNQTFNEKLVGILTVEPVVGYDVNAPINATLLNAAFDIWKQYEPESFPGPTNVTNDALFAFDATWLLIQSLQQLCSAAITNFSSCLSVLNTSRCFDRRFLNTTAFFDTITATEFLGVSGPIKFNVNETDRINGTYYLVKNIQPFSNGIDYVSILKWSGDGKWEPYVHSNIIVWPGNSLITPTDRPDLLDVHIRIGVVESPPFLMVINITDISKQNKTKFIGYAPDLIDLLQTKMRFIPDIILAPSNQTYDGLIQAVANGIYDIVIGDVTVTAARREIVDFSSSIFDNSMRIIVRQSTSSDVDLFDFLKPFSISLWLTLLAAVIYAGILLCLLERQSNEAIKDKSIVSAGTMSVWYSYGNIMGYGVDFDVRTAAGRLLTAGLYVLSLILVATYTANLASNLTISKSKGAISGIDDIKNGKLPFNRIGILTDSSLEDYYLREISGGSRNFYPVKTVDEVFSDLLNNIIDASIFDTGVLEYATSTVYCNLTLVGSDFGPSAYGIVIPKQWIYAQVLDVNILSLRETGALDDLKRKWFEGKTCPESSLSTDTPTAISVTAMAGLFLTFTVISILSILLFAWTKRFIIKYYLCGIIYRNKSLVQQIDSVTEDSTETDCTLSSDSQVALRSIIHS